MRLIIIIFLSFFVGYSQEIEQKKIDSLQNILKGENINFTEKIETLNRLTNIISKSDLKQGEILNKKLFVLSKSKNYLKGIAFYYQNISREMMYKSNFKYAEKYAKNAQLIFKKIKDNNNYISSTNNICYAKDMQGTQANFDDAEKLARKTIIEYENKPNSNNIVNLYYYLAVSYNYEKKPNLVFLYLNKAMDIYRKRNDYDGVYSCLFQCAYIYNINDMNNKSINLLNQIEKSSNHIINSSINKQLRLQELYLTNYSKLKQYNKALAHCKIFYTIANKNKIDSEIELANYFFAEIYINLKNNKKALKYIKILDKNDKYNLGNFDLNKIKHQYYFLVKDYKKALYFAKENYLIDSTEILNLKFLAETEYNLNNHKKSHFYFQKHIEFYTKKIEKEKNNKIYEYETLFDLKNKDIALQKSKLENVKKETALQKQTEYNTLLIIGTILLLLFFLFLIYGYQTKKKVNKLLNIKNNELNEINTLLRNSVNEKEILLKEIHHRVKNNLQLVMSLLNIQAQDSQNISIQDFIEKGQSRIATMSLIHQNLYQTDNFVEINFETYLINLIENIKQTFSNNNVEFEINTYDNSFNLDTSIPRLIWNLVIY
jgi:two-component sensor histidine kinase